MREVCRRSSQAFGNGQHKRGRHPRNGDGCGWLALAVHVQSLVEHVDEIEEIRFCNALIQRHSDTVLIDMSNIYTSLDCCGVHVGHLLRLDREGIEESVAVDDLIIERLEGVLEEDGHGVYLFCDFSQTFGSVIDGIHGCHISEQGLTGTDVARRFLSPNVLLTRCHIVSYRPGPARNGLLCNANR